MWLRFVTQGMDRDTGGQGRFTPAFQEHLREPGSAAIAQQEPTFSDPLPPGALRKEAPGIHIAPASQSADAARGRLGVRKKASPKPSRKSPILLIVVMVPMAAMAAVGGAYFWKPALLQPVVEKMGLSFSRLSAGRPPVPSAGLPSAGMSSAKPVVPMPGKPSAGSLPGDAHPPLPPSAGTFPVGGQIASATSMTSPAQSGPMTASVQPGAGTSGSGHPGSTMPLLPPQTLPGDASGSVASPSAGHLPLPLQAGNTNASAPSAAAVQANGGFAEPWNATVQTTSAGKPIQGAQAAPLQEPTAIVTHPAKPVAPKPIASSSAAGKGPAAVDGPAARLPAPASSETAPAKPASTVVARPVAPKPVYHPAWHPVYHPVYRPAPRPAPVKPAPENQSAIASVF